VISPTNEGAGVVGPGGVNSSRRRVRVGLPDLGGDGRRQGEVPLGVDLSHVRQWPRSTCAASNPCPPLRTSVANRWRNWLGCQCGTPALRDAIRTAWA
jgi:hypothetical protein